MATLLDYGARISVICEAPYMPRGHYFTHGRTYEARHSVNSLYRVICDLGHVRYFIPDAPCPHLIPTAAVFRSDSLGTFRTVHP